MNGLDNTEDTKTLRTLIDARGWTLIRVLGSGGMGQLYTVSEPELERQMAIKTARGPDGFSWRRLQREAMITAHIAGEGVATVHGAGVLEDGRPWFSMALIDGDPLSVRWGDAQPQDARLELVPILTRVCQRLARIHRLGVIHRDLKPANLIVGAQGEVTILDWGLARMGSETAQPDSAWKTRQGTRLGTPSYMSPEQAVGLPVDARADVWALGILLWEALAGCQAYTGSRPPKVVAQILRGPPPMAPIQWAGPELVAVVQAALAPLEERLPNAGALHAALTAPPQARRRPWVVVGALMVGALAVSGWLRPEPPAPLLPLSSAEVLAVAAQDAARAGRWYRSKQLAAEALEAGAPDHLRGLLLVPDAQPQLLLDDEREPCDIGENFSPFGDILMCANTNHTIAYSISADGMVEHWRQEVEIHQLAYQGSDFVLGQVPAQEALVRLSTAHGGLVGYHTNMDTGQLADSLDPNSMMRLIGTDRQRYDVQLDRWDSRPAPCASSSAMILPDGDELYVCANALVLIDDKTLQERNRWVLLDQTDQIAQFSVSPDGQHIALLTYSGMLGTISGQDPIRWTTEVIVRGGYLTISPDGRYVAAGSYVDTQVFAIDGSVKWRLPGVGALVRFNAQGQLISMTQTWIQIWALPDTTPDWSIGGRLLELDWNDDLLARRAGGAVFRYPETTPMLEDVKRVAVNPWGGQVAVVRKDGQLQIDGGAPLAVEANCLGLEWLDSDTLLCAPDSPGPIRINTQTSTLDHHLGIPGTSWFTTSGYAGRVALLEWSGTIWSTDGADTPLRRSATYPWTNNIAMHPSGLSVALGGSWGVGVLSLEDDTITARLETGTRVGRVAYSPDGRWLAATTYLSDLLLYRDNVLVSHSIIDDSRAMPVAFSPDSTQVAVGGASGSIRLLELSDLERPLDEVIAEVRTMWGTR